MVHLTQKHNFRRDLRKLCCELHHKLEFALFVEALSDEYDAVPNYDYEGMYCRCYPAEVQYKCRTMARTAAEAYTRTV
jgi:hypothetical protein